MRPQYGIVPGHAVIQLRTFNLLSTFMQHVLLIGLQQTRIALRATISD